jgi:uncharacterized protein
VDVIHVVLAFVIILLAALIQSVTGSGFVIFAIPLFSLLYPAHYAISLCIFLSLLSSLFTLPRVRIDMDKPLLKRLFIGSLMGMPFGGIVYYMVDVRWLKLIVGISIIISVVLMVFRSRFPVGTGKRIGFLSGMMTSSIGMPGPPINLYMNANNVGKQVYRGTSIAYYCLVYPISLLIQFASGHIKPDLIGVAAMVPAIFVGQAIGSVLYQRVSQSWFRRITLVILLATGLNALIQSL